MGLFDGYYDPDQFEASGGLLGRLLSLQRQEGFLPHPDFDLPPPGAQPPTPSLMPWVASGSPSPAQALQPHYEALRAAFAGGNGTTPGASSAPSGSMPLVRPLANVERSESSSAGTQPNAVQNALTDFYRQTILQAGKDIAGYASDAIHDPETFARGIAPSVAGLGPLVGELPTAIRGLVGATRIAGWGAPSPKIEDEGDKPASTPIGRRGNPIEVTPGTNRPVKIDGRLYSGHAVDQMQGRGVPSSAVEDTIRNGQLSPGNNPGETSYASPNGVKVVTGADGQVITVITVKR